MENEVHEDSCQADAAGSGFAIQAGGQSLAGATEATGSWDDFQSRPVGTLTFDQAGKQTVTFKPTTPWKGIGLRSVTLTKTP